MHESIRNGELQLKLTDPSHNQLHAEGVSRFVGGDRDHPAARYFARLDIREQFGTRDQSPEPRILSQEASQIVMFST